VCGPFVVTGLRGPGKPGRRSRGVSAAGSGVGHTEGMRGFTGDPRTVGFLAVGGLAVAGTMAGQLGATSAATYAAGGAAGTATSIFLALMLTSAALAGVGTTRLAARWGTLRTFGWAQAGVAVSWLVAGILEALTDSSLVLLFLAAPIFGVFSGVTGVLTPFACRSYIDAGSLTSSVAKRGSVSGIGAIIGSLVGGYLIHATDPGIGILANGLLTIPLVGFVLLVRPRSAAAAPRAVPHAIRAIAREIQSNERLRRLVLLLIAFMLLVVPMTGLIVPILNDLDHAPLPSGAGLMLAGIAAGRLFVPRIVKELLARHSQFSASVRGTVLTALFLIAFGVTALFTFSDADLVIWTLIGIGIGAGRFTTKALMTGAVASAMPRGDEMLGVTALVIVASLSSPVGFLIWGPLIDLLSAPAVVISAGLVMVAVAVLLGRAANRA